MRVAFYGAGGVGGYLGGRLAQSGEEVVLIARGEHLRAIQTHGLRVESINGDFTVRPALATDDPMLAGMVDVVMVCVKAWQLPEATEAMGPLIGPETFVIPLQNGVEAPSQLLAVLSSKHVVGGLCRVITSVAGPGHVKHLYGGRLTIGELDGRFSQRTQQVQAAFEQAGVPVEVTPNIQAALWEKLLLMAPWSGLGAITRAPAGVWRSLPQTRWMVEQVMQEVLDVAQARNIHLPDNAMSAAIAAVDRLPPDATASMQRDIMEGRPSELEYQNGAVVRLGREVSVDTPVNAFIYSSLLPQELRGRGQEGFQP